MIKTMKHEEMRLLLELMPQYYSHVESNHNTLLTRFHAVHRVKPLGGQKVNPGGCLVQGQGQLAHLQGHLLSTSPVVMGAL